MTLDDRLAQAMSAADENDAIEACSRMLCQRYTAAVQRYAQGLMSVRSGRELAIVTLALGCKWVTDPLQIRASVCRQYAHPS